LALSTVISLSGCQKESSLQNEIVSYSQLSSTKAQVIVDHPLSSSQSKVIYNIENINQDYSSWLVSSFCVQDIYEKNVIIKKSCLNMLKKN